MSRSVYWYDGMFFWPQHMQAAERFLSGQMAQGQQWNVHYNWGLRGIDIDPEALTNYRFVIRALQARLPQGTLVEVPTSGSVPELDLKPLLTETPTVTLYLALANVQLGQENTADEVRDPESTAPETDAEIGKAEGHRYKITNVTVEDENVGGNAHAIQARWLNLKILSSNESLAGYEVLPIARIKSAETPEAAPELDRSYIPPVLSCDAWPPFRADILQVSYDRIGQKIEGVAAEVVTRGISFDTKHYGAPKRMGQLHVLNEANALLTTLAFVEGVHPLKAYIELCRIVGKLAIFGPTRETPVLPPYDHDDLGGCFFRVKQYLDELLEEIAEPEYEQRPFIGEKLRMQVVLNPEWLQPLWQMFVGVRSSLDPQECVRMLTKSNQLDMKIGSSTRVDEIFDRGGLGLQFTHTAQLPQALPEEPGLIYFQIGREAEQEEWHNVEQSKTLAIRLNQHRIDGDIHGQQVLSISTGGQATTMEFTLYLVAEQKA